MASLLTIWGVPAATTEPTIESVPPAVLEGKDVLLLAHDLPDAPFAYQWFRGKRSVDKDLIIAYETKSQETKEGTLYSGRETLYPNGSLMLQNVTLKQSGIYSLNIRSADDQKAAFVEVFVYPLLSKPSIRSNRTTAVEGQDTVELTCEPSFRKTTYLWFLNVSRHFSGRYECEVKNPLSAFRSDPFTLDVFYGPDTPEIFPPHKYFEEGRSMWLSCQTVSHPKAHYSWNVNGEPWNSRQEVSIHQVSISNNGLYTCLANNPATGRNNSKVKEVVIVEKLPKPHIQVKSETVLEHHLVDLTCVSENTGVSIWWTFNNQKLKATDRVSFSWNNRRLTIDPVTKEDAGAYQCEVSSPLDSRQSDPVNLAVLYQPSKRSRLSPLLLAGMAAEVLAGLAILGGLMYFAFFKRLDHRESHTGIRREERKKRKRAKEQYRKARSNSILMRTSRHGRPGRSAQQALQQATPAATRRRLPASALPAAAPSHASQALDQRGLSTLCSGDSSRFFPQAAGSNDNSAHELRMTSNTLSRTSTPSNPTSRLQPPG
ncbi:CEA-related cell adhesion molecule 1 [Apodemus speciosus]|uniref:CEA-related cell adhesion molecule 1 n=1 Tax=Apodemus speciosus TaxID=105296 RepID=A0ABQ0EY35_APOSI